MSVYRIHTYTVEPADLDEFIARRATLIATIRAAHTGLLDARLLRNEDGTYTDTWEWESLPAMAAAFPLAGGPEAAAAMALTREATARNAELIDRR
ncbi:antibiotic biosynthesis monooxygenase [Actinorhabdospora filicis]|uniref:antibiotic biosynthesis monooxygenase n=1 Tax=Actinorhabdospora filicis TaxID=1785913 RepID=UPI002555328D|nr:antibiotic biosynthesis monooxygenase [Actinorhabdospora filicis]